MKTRKWRQRRARKAAESRWRDREVDSTEFSEIGRKLHMSPKTVQSICNRALRKLLPELEARGITAKDLEVF